MATVAMKEPPDGATTDSGIMHTEFNDIEYVREVLRLDDGKTEAILDATFTTLAEELGITTTTTRPSSRNGAHASMCDSSATFTTNHARTGSTTSRHSTSTGITSRSSNEAIYENGNSARRSEVRNSVSFTEYEKLVQDTEAQLLITTGIAPPPIPTTKTAPSLFSVSTRKSYSSFKSNFKNKFRFRRSNVSQENLR